MLKIDKDLKKSIAGAVNAFQKGKIKPLRTKKPVKTRITFTASQYADVAELLPVIKRLDGLSVEYAAKTLKEACSTFELLLLASAGMSASLESTR